MCIAGGFVEFVGIDDIDGGSELGHGLEPVGLERVKILEFFEVGLFDLDIAKVIGFVGHDEVFCF